MKQRFMDTSDWLSEFKKGNARAFQYVFDNYNKRLYYYAVQLLNNSEEAEDIVSDTFKKLWEKAADINSLQHIEGFLYTSTRNACINKSKQLQRQEEIHRQLSYSASEVTDHDLLNAMIEGELLAKIYAAIETLPRKCKAIFKLSYLEGLSTEEIAQAMNISTRNVLNQKNRAIQLLKAKLLTTLLVYTYMIYLLFK